MEKGKHTLTYWADLIVAPPFLTVFSVSTTFSVYFVLVYCELPIITHFQIACVRRPKDKAKTKWCKLISLYKNDLGTVESPLYYVPFYRFSIVNLLMYIYRLLPCNHLVHFKRVFAASLDKNFGPPLPLQTRGYYSHLLNSLFLWTH